MLVISSYSRSSQGHKLIFKGMKIVLRNLMSTDDSHYCNLVKAGIISNNTTQHSMQLAIVLILKNNCHFYYEVFLYLS